MWANQQTGFNPTTPAPTPDQFASGQPASQGSGGRRRGRCESGASEDCEEVRLKVL